MTAADLARLVVDTLDLQQRYFNARMRKDTNTNGLLIESKRKEAELRRSATVIIGVQGSLFDEAKK